MVSAACLNTVLIHTLYIDIQILVLKAACKLNVKALLEQFTMSYREILDLFSVWLVNFVLLLSGVHAVNTRLLAGCLK